MQLKILTFWTGCSVSSEHYIKTTEMFKDSKYGTDSLKDIKPSIKKTMYIKENENVRIVVALHMLTFCQTMISVLVYSIGEHIK